MSGDLDTVILLLAWLGWSCAWIAHRGKQNAAALERLADAAEGRRR